MCSSSPVRCAICGLRLAAITLLACDNSRATRLHVMDKKDDMIQRKDDKMMDKSKMMDKKDDSKMMDKKQ
jgi:hypothetical protein